MPLDDLSQPTDPRAGQPRRDDPRGYPHRPRSPIPTTGELRTARHRRIAQAIVRLVAPGVAEPGQSLEPARIIGLISVAAIAILGVLAAFGLPISDAQSDAILTAIPVVVAAIWGIVEWIRARVYSPATTRRLVLAAATEATKRAEGTPEPALGEPGAPEAYRD